MQYQNKPPRTKITRLGVALQPEGDFECEGVLNPASAIDRSGNLLLYTRAVGKGNVSRVGLVRVSEANGTRRYERLGFALEPQADYELNGSAGQGCEDPRVTFVPELDLYLMSYTAYGTAGPRPAAAFSKDGYSWERLGLIEFPAELNLSKDDKDVAFFPESVTSPQGVKSFALYHRPMVSIPARDGLNDIQSVLARPAEERQSIRIAYVPVEDVLRDLHNLTRMKESALVLSPGDQWGMLKVGGGTPPVRIDEGWLSIYHGVDAIEREPGKYAMRYSAGIMLHDIDRPDKVLYCSQQKPVLVPKTPEELLGTVNNVVFPTAIVPRPDLGTRVWDVYYGMADFRIGWFRLELSSPSKPRRKRSTKKV